jgi:hypothetical protein
MVKTIFLLFLTSFCFSQKQITFIDSLTKRPIGYASIWKENQIYKTTDSLGVLNIENDLLDKTFKITALGYKEKVFKIVTNEVSLSPETSLLNEVKIYKRKKTISKKIGNLKRSGVLFCTQYDAKESRFAHYFPNSQNELVFLDKVKLHTSTTAKNRIFSVLFYSVNETTGEPDKVLNTETIICRPKKGNTLNTIDVSDVNVVIPNNGIFIVIEVLLLEQNKNYDKKSNHPLAFMYEPCFNANSVSEFKDSWYFKDNLWQKSIRLSYNLAIEISN